MPKIYNEIVIDMNPQSPSFEKVIYEDSFEYSGDMMLMQSEQITEGTEMAVEGKDNLGNQEYKIYKWTNGAWVYTAKHSWRKGDLGRDIRVYSSLEAATAASGTKQEAYGAPTLTREDFYELDGSQRDPKEVVKKLKAAGAEGTDAAILKQVMDQMPKLLEVPEEEKMFKARERGFAEREAGLGLATAGRTREKDLFGLQKQAGKMGAQMRGAYGGMGGGARGTIAGQAAMGTGFGMAQEAYGGAQDAYGLAMDKAAFEEEKGLYGLEKDMYGEFESDVATTFLQKREGGRVPSKQTFLDLLTQLPDAGGS
jgi:hypothetical protein